MPELLKKVLDWYSLFDTVFSIVTLCMTRLNVKVMAMFLYNNPKVIPLVVFVFAGLAYGFLRLCVLVYATVLGCTYHLAGVKDGSYKLNPILRYVMIVASLRILGLSAAIVISPVIYLEKGILQNCIITAAGGFGIFGILFVLMCGLPNAFVQKYFKLFFYPAVLGFVTACLSYSVLAVWQMIIA